MKKRLALVLAIAAVLVCISVIILICITNNGEKNSQYKKTEENQDTTASDEELTSIEQNPIEDIEVPVANTYIYENVGFYSDFYLVLHEEGYITYMEGYPSSYLGSGAWELVDDELTIYEDGMGYIREIHFTLGKDHCLYYHKTAPYPFIFTDLDEGAKFIPESLITEEQRAKLDAQAKEMEDNLTELLAENRLNEQVLNEVLVLDFNNEGVSGTINADATRYVWDCVSPIRIWLSSPTGEVLWEDSLGIYSNNWNSYYIYHGKDSDYLLQYYAKETEYVQKYTASLFSIDAAGNKSVVWETFAYTEEAKKAFDQKVDPYLRKSEIIFSTLNSDINYTGRLY